MPTSLPLLCSPYSAPSPFPSLSPSSALSLPQFPLPLPIPCRALLPLSFVSANHCPGAALFVFHVGMDTHVHCGDMRFEPSLLSEGFPAGLAGLGRIDHLYLDTTYCDSRYAFPPQAEVLAAVRGVVLHEEGRAARGEGKERVLYVCGAYTIGKEKVWLQVFSALGCRGTIQVDARRKRTLDCLDLHRVLAALGDEHCSARSCPPGAALTAGGLRRTPAVVRVVTDPSRVDAQVRVKSMGSLSDSALKELLESPTVKAAGFTRLVAFRPTGWSFSEGRQQAVRCQKVLTPRTSTACLAEEVGGSAREAPGSGGRITVVSIPYSEHSSVAELSSMVRHLRPARVIPTVAKSSAHRTEIMKLLGLA
eukprot:CAMPEP_0117663316 /NCGR_PEP_ID=MMETSP0804-20121206/8536_1 /TAXON_ID=1074897 /ORGANISM="Tetraselmis astigmatica, Strain CCMP880" /LENGTH=363 /DNA_ID=CAMNT_0005470303 /DNA_START=437 /DNA_END=1528 /DNA_ORIENTATION=-